MLLFGILAIAANAQTLSQAGRRRSVFVFSRGLQPLLVGVLVLGIGLSLGGPTGYAINPARDLGPRLAHAILPIPGKGGSDWEYAGFRSSARSSAASSAPALLSDRVLIASRATREFCTSRLHLAADTV